MARIRYIVHPDDKRFLVNKVRNGQELSSMFVYFNQEEGISQIHNVLTIPLKQTAYIRYIIHPEDRKEAEYSGEWEERYEEIRVLFDEYEGKTVIAQVDNRGTAYDETKGYITVGGSQPGNIKHSEVKIVRY